MQLKLPAPYPDPIAWDANMQAGMNSDPRRKANYDIYKNAQRTKDLNYMPTRLDIENVSRCNFRCTMCQVSEWGPTYQRAEDMSLEDFKHLIDEQYGLIEIKIQGMGEPLLGRETFFEMIKYARSKHIWVRSTTNASLLHFRENYKNLIDSGINELQVSIDGATKDTFEKIRGGSKFEQVVDNCKLLNQYCIDMDVLRTRMWTVIQRDNVGEFLQFVDLAHEMKFRRLTFSLDLTSWGQDHWVQVNKGKNIESDVTEEMAQQAIAIGQSRGVEVTFMNQIARFKTGSAKEICHWPFSQAYVSSDMRIVPCCYIASPEVAELGDARDFSKVWTGDSFKEFRQAHLDGRIPVSCQQCYESNSGE